MIVPQRILLVVSSFLGLALFADLYRQSDAVPRGRPFKHAHNDSGPSVPAGNSTVAKTAAPVLHADDHCSSLSGLSDIVIVLKTGASEIYSKLPIHFATTFACGHDFLIYSDVAQDFGNVRVHDALAPVSNVVQDSQEFAAYWHLQQYVRLGGDAVHFKGEQSWKLDKYKFLPMVSDAYARYGDSKKWFVFIEADTYLSLHNLELWLSELDSRKPIYAGAQVYLGETEFAHGGSGFLLSTPAAKIASDRYHANRTGWDTKLGSECCGDVVLGDLLMSARPEVPLLRSFPHNQGETLSSLDWSPRHWCMPAVSWHHADTAAVDKLWSFERGWTRRWGPDAPMLFRDYFAAFVEPRLKAASWKMRAWDNLSDEWTYSAEGHPEEHAHAHESAEACEWACQQREGCLQWAFRPESCRGDKTIRLGWALDQRPDLGSANDRVINAGGDDDDQAVSGWMRERVQAYKRTFEPCGERSHWITGDED